MFALDLFNNDHERHLAEGAVDQLEQRRIDDLAMKMDDLVARAKTATTPEVKAALIKEFQKCKAERDGYFKIKEAGIPGSVPADKIPGKEDLLKGRGRSYYEDQKKNAEVTDPAQDRLLTRAHREFPKARSDAEALAMKILSKEQDDVSRLDRVNDREDRMIDRLSNLEKSLQQQIDQLKGAQDLDEGRMGEIDAMRQDLERMNERQFYTAYGISKAAFQQKYRTLLKPALDESQQLHQGDPIVVTAPNEFEGATGEIYDFAPSGTFVIVDLYNHGKHSMHLSDIEYNEYADQEQDEEDDWYDDEELNEFAPGAGRDEDEVPDQILKLANRWWNATDNQPRITNVLRSLGWSIAQVESEDDAVQMQHDDGTTYFISADEFDPDVFEGFQDFNKVEPYAVCLAGKPVKQFDYYEDARRFHDNWKKKLYREGNKEKADKITLMPLNLDEGARGDAIKQGYQAAVKGLTKQQNPYYKSVNGQTPPEAYDWEAGWEDARDSGKIPQGVAEGFFGDIKQSFATGMVDKLKKAIPAQYHKHYDFDSVKSPGDTKAIVARARAAGHLKESGVAEDTDSWFRVTVKTPNGKNHNIQVPANSHGTAKRKALAYCAKNGIAGAEFVSAMRMPTLDEQGVAEGEGIDPKIQFLQPTIQFAEKLGYRVTLNPQGRVVAKLVNKQLGHIVHIGLMQPSGKGFEVSMADNLGKQTNAWSAKELAQDFKGWYAQAVKDQDFNNGYNEKPQLEQQGVAEGSMDELTPYELGEAEGLSGEYYENPYPEGSKSYAEYRQGWRDGTKQAEANRDVDETYTPSPAKPFRNPPGFNKQGTGVGNKLAQLNRAELANIKPSTGTPVPGKEFAQGVLKDLKKVNVKEIKADPAGSWIVYGGSKVMKFKTHSGAKAYAEKSGGKVASSEFYADKIQKQGVTEGAMSNLHAELSDVYNRMAPGIERNRDSFKAGQLYDALEAVAEQHGAEAEFKRMMAGARNRAHMDYDTNPGGFQNWFWYLPFDNEELSEEQDTSGVESAIIRRIMVAHTDLLKQFGPQKVMQAAEEVAYNVGDVDEIGTSDVSAYVDQVRQILGA